MNDHKHDCQDGVCAMPKKEGDASEKKSCCGDDCGCCDATQKSEGCCDDCEECGKEA